MAIEEEKKLPVDATVEASEAETAGELDHAELDNVAGGAARPAAS